jgi:O-antigen/teichoic acid export membrane protein
LALVILFAGSRLIDLVFGEHFVQSGSINTLMVLIWMIPILAWRRHSRSAMIIINRQREELLCSLIGLIVLVLLLVSLILTYGPVGSAWAMVISELVASVVIWYRLKTYVPKLNLFKHLFSVSSLKHTPERSS